MTLPSLLRHVGVHVPRGVTIDGRIVLGDETGTAVTPLTPHTFHGGTAPPDAPVKPWWDADLDRRAADILAVSRHFPGFRFDDRGGRYRYDGTINTGRGRFGIAIVGNRTGGLPHVVPVTPRTLGRREGRRGVRRAEHLYTNGNLCVADTKEWNADDHNTVTAIAWAAHWLAAYTDWRLGGPWPTIGYHPND
jgi:hypothetical protein